MPLYPVGEASVSEEFAGAPAGSLSEGGLDLLVRFDIGSEERRYHIVAYLRPGRQRGERLLRVVIPHRRFYISPAQRTQEGLSTNPLPET